MSVTKRFLLLPLFGVFLTTAAYFVGLHTYIFVIFNLLSAGLLALDFFMTPGNAFTVSRKSDEKLFYKAENEISFTVENTSGYPLRVQARDEINDLHFTVTKQSLSRTVMPGGGETFTYAVVPSKRGAFLFHNIHLRYKGLLGLCVKYAVIPCPFDFKVYPNLKDLSKYRLMTQKSRLLPQGHKTVRLYGAGAEFESLRAYVDGDDYRKINWMATARENKLTVNQYQSEKNQPVFILLDAGRPMSYTVNGYKKLDYAVNAALILSDIVNSQNDNSGLLVFDETVRGRIMPGKGAAHRNRLMEALYHIEDSRATSDYESAFKQLCENQKRRSLVFIFTDFEILEEAEALTAHMEMLKRRHLPVVVFMKNENLTALAEQRAYGRKNKILRETAQEFLAERKRIFQTLNALRIPNIECEAERFAAEAVNQYLALQARRVY
ncbi:MAG: DUF58 domain-containing protein [Clostridiales bacterium]|jgi:uncharacterized protein (DUF58 family)|nr:DUF58 domain-containing protein [Clostridiales bacterium]